MNQKTIYIDPTKIDLFDKFNPEDARVGDEVILVEYTNINTGNRWFKLIPHKGNGIPGNRDRSICCYHGWRGTTNGIEVWAHGLRKIIKITLASYKEASEREWKGLPLRRKDYHAVTVGKDIHPDWE